MCLCQIKSICSSSRSVKCFQPLEIPCPRHLDVNLNSTQKLSTNAPWTDQIKSNLIESHLSNMGQSAVCTLPLKLLPSPTPSSLRQNRSESSRQAHNRLVKEPAVNHPTLTQTAGSLTTLTSRASQNPRSRMPGNHLKQMSSVQ